ncbi:MAG: polysaccharide pyruvyl transferase family protein [Tessaracoccus sp.]|uniref:polysaccharide pyruvyl transferase family protein n=1 Tax=Tessaracoccus sp. TaxID=1971211 RepID=UPI001ECB5189|nr:polysaccharide pyruvyl transferase family protein [Tessaracoccus sp.]MBK7820153.1 polysaccharide pyruvyl transferase family protein [Tessaracoccus sp.]
MPATPDPLRILLLTNRDWDNVGDQLIEACAISLIESAMKNLGWEHGSYQIDSRDAEIIPQRYRETGDTSLLGPARAAISNADLIVFGGSPLFNYAYQDFYLRTIKTLELAQEYGVPAIFSSIGVETFNGEDPKAIALKEALALSVVRQITTRDDLDSLRMFTEGTGLPTALVADPAVFTDLVLGPAAARPAEPRTERRIGLMVTRAGIFKDNGLPFTARRQRRFWRDVVTELTARGYDYRLFTTGHFADETLLDQMVKEDGFPLRKACIAVNSPEELQAQLTACDGVIAFRLHASIAAFAYGIPCIGLSWNPKVPYFYQSVGLAHRALPVERWSADEVVPALETAMAEGVHKDIAFLMTVYESLFSGIRSVVAPDNAVAPYSHDQLRAELQRYPGTTPQEYRAKVTRKLRRAYEAYQRHAFVPAQPRSIGKMPA